MVGKAESDAVGLDEAATEEEAAPWGRPNAALSRIDSDNSQPRRSSEDPI
jgi:hypothetical protein